MHNLLNLLMTLVTCLVSHLCFYLCPESILYFIHHYSFYLCNNTFYEHSPRQLLSEDEFVAAACLNCSGLCTSFCLLQFTSAVPKLYMPMHLISLQPFYSFNYWWKCKIHITRASCKSGHNNMVLDSGLPGHIYGTAQRERWALIIGPM